MFKLLSELNIDKKDYKNLAILPGFNISGSNCMNEKFTLLNKKFDGSDILDEKVFIFFFYLASIFLNFLFFFF